MSQELAKRIEPVDLERRDDGFRSVQQLSANPHEEMTVTMQRYFDWLQSTFRGVVAVTRDSAADSIVLFFAGAPAIRLQHRRSSVGRVEYAVMGGLLARRNGEFSFVRKQDGTTLAILDGFRPRLPEWLYARTQGRIHALIMRRFSRALESAQ